jgi:hypothetical protein
MSDRKYPDIEFVETDTETIESNLIALYENMVQQVPGREHYKVYPASPERLFISWVANIIVQQRVIINETAKKNVPRYADGEYLDSLAELFKDLERMPASPASAMFRFYISQAQTQSVIIPAGTRISFDGAILFETKEILEIKAGQTYGDVEGVCTTAGTFFSWKQSGSRAGQRNCGPIRLLPESREYHSNQRRCRGRRRRQLL